MSAVEQGKAVVKTIRQLIGGFTQARGAAGRAAGEKSAITSDVDAVKAAGKEVTEGLAEFTSAESKLDADVKDTAANVSADIAAVKGAGKPAPAAKADTAKADVAKATAAPAAKKAEKTTEPAAAAKTAPKAAPTPTTAPSAPKTDPTHPA
ncbi:colicin import membrane protein [Tsukamurella pulmonis]|uniref:Colicin import membrane protein n=1 Tax=Tsukamurella pulmonis TaxID=47312 RepID=A0A1H1HPE1_9ACTN|nr:hypothetical protein [Tsukamurella pulmonis]SDR27267.1 colicin import membrane protein [Tsukamurella pulmonis]SUP13743.1 Uncharacterised protein [Tsukamurella pulmonis]